MSQKAQRSPPTRRLKFLNTLLQQDWSHLFPGYDAKARYYVYAHIDPRGSKLSLSPSIGGLCPGMPFYIGKGIGDRAYNLNRNQGHGKMLAHVKASGAQPKDIVHIMKSGMTEAEAFELEAKLVYFFGTIYEPNRHGILLNLDPCPRPIFSSEIQKQTVSAKSALATQQPSTVDVRVAP